jgi:GT2 family glycosyltransferase
MNRPTTVGVIFVNWNGWQHTIAACRSLDQSSHKAIEIIIVDNASADDSLTRLRAALPQAHIIANAFNAGFAGACNIGIRHAVQLGCEYVYLLNNDAVAESETIANLVQGSKSKDDSALLGSVLIYISSGTYQFFGSRTGNVVREPEFLTFERDAALLSEDFIETDFIVGAAFFIPVRMLDQNGPFDERFFLNYEETDFCYRARKLGIPSFIIPASVVHHHANAAIGHYPAPMYAYFLARNGLLFAEKHAPREQRRLLSRLKRIYWDIRRVRKTARRKDLPTWAILRAFWDYTWRRFGDCPAAIRRYDAIYRVIPFQPSSSGKKKV